MSLWNDKTISGWGRTSAAHVPTARPETEHALSAAWAAPFPLLPVGLGRSYGDQAVPDAATGTRAVLSSRLDKFQSFDPQTGLLVAESGVSLAEIVRLFVPRGWFVPAMPGTGFVSIGGAIANDVHGKNHPVAGTFGRHVVWLDILLPQGALVRCSRELLPELFFSTLGGCGLTGFVVRAAVQLTPIEGPHVAVVRERIEDMDALFSTFARTPREQAPYKVMWIDALATGDCLGRGIYEEACFTTESARRPSSAAPSLPFDFPNFALNPLTIKIFNEVYYRAMAGRKPKRHLVAPETFFMPLDKILNWNRMYGPRGFHQFQALIPAEVAPHGLRSLLEVISQSRKASFLAVVKQYGAEGEGYLSFPAPGFTLALDFPSGPDIQALLARLIAATRDFGGRVYLAKDSALMPHDLEAMYPRLPLFKQVLAALDPGGRMRSGMGARLGLTQELQQDLTLERASA